MHKGRAGELDSAVLFNPRGKGSFHGDAAPLPQHAPLPGSAFLRAPLFVRACHWGCFLSLGIFANLAMNSNCCHIWRGPSKATQSTVSLEVPSSSLFQSAMCSFKERVYKLCLPVTQNRLSGREQEFGRSN